jgi:hypothetical protein
MRAGRSWALGGACDGGRSAVAIVVGAVVAIVVGSVSSALTHIGANSKLMVPWGRR